MIGEDDGDDVLASLESIIADTIDNRLKEVNTCLPGQIVTYYPESQTADIQPTLKRRFMQKNFEQLPVCPNVPLIFPGGGGFGLTFPLKPGDECLLLFAQRAIDKWWLNGGIQDPVDFRKHHLSDALGIIGLRNRNRLAQKNTTDCSLSSDDGTIHITLQANKAITLQADRVHIKGALEVSGDITASGLSFIHHRHGGVEPGGGQTTGPI